jgi:hypothetical protein
MVRRQTYLDMNLEMSLDMNKVDIMTQVLQREKSGMVFTVSNTGPAANPSIGVRYEHSQFHSFSGSRISMRFLSRTARA